MNKRYSQKTKHLPAKPVDEERLRREKEAYAAPTLAERVKKLSRLDYTAKQIAKKLNLRMITVESILEKGV